MLQCVAYLRAVGVLKDEAHLRRAELLLACEHCVRHDLKLALQLLPYLTKLLLAAEDADASNLVLRGEGYSRDLAEL